MKPFVISQNIDNGGRFPTTIHDLWNGNTKEWHLLNEANFAGQLLTVVADQPLMLVPSDMATLALPACLPLSYEKFPCKILDDKETIFGYDMTNSDNTFAPKCWCSQQSHQ